MAEIVVSSFLSVIFEKLASAALETLAPYAEISSDIKKLERSLLQIRGVLADASRKEITDQSVKRWLNGLHHLAYDIDDVLDEIATEAMHREFSDESETHFAKVAKFFSNHFSKHSLWSRTMKEKINGITTKLHDLIEEKDALGLVVKAETSTRSRNVNRRLQSSLVHASSIVGRQQEKDALIHNLLEEGPSDQNFSVVPIVGMGGIGKTTLARLVYGEQQVRDHFELKAWVCVSDEFDSFRISQEILEAVAKENKTIRSYDLLQDALRKHLKGKKLLLVLDDVWSERCDDWEALVGPFHECASGSKIIMTTRKDRLIKMLGYRNVNHMRSLLDDDALSLLALHAFGDQNFDSHLSLKPYGVGIVKKCDGLPLALKALGRLLSTKKYKEEHWKEMIGSEIWELPVEGDIVPALILSYHDLSTHLKQLFAYCSLFPKDYIFDKNILVQLWKDEGFLHESTPTNSRKESLGREYFDELFSRSFFQHAPNNKSLFVMHDLMNDLAVYVAGNLFLRLEKDTKNEALEKYRHMSFVHEWYLPYKKFEAFKKAKSLRTFFGVAEGWSTCYFPNKILDDLLPELSLLRVLCFSNLNLSEVPDSIGTLKHLRYLNLSRTKITYLPENVCNLYNLEVLILFSCYSLAKLPDNFLKLKNLQHFDIRETPCLKKMPLEIAELKSLKILSKVIIGVEDGIEINKLKDLKHLCGNISIVGLDKVQNAIHAQEANISQKKFSELELVWSDVSDGSRNEMLEKDVLNELKPRNECLKKLKIVSYGGLEFPKWLGDPMFLRLKHVSIRNCKSCTCLPSLGQLPSLKELFIKKLHGLEVLGLEFLGTSPTFCSLEILNFENMQGWKKWSMSSGNVFPCLRKLKIKDCPNLVEVTLEPLLSLNVLKIERCDKSVLKSLVKVASSLTKLEISFISRLNDVAWRVVIKYLSTVKELSIGHCNEIRYLWESEEVASKVLVNLRNLKVEKCDNLVSLGEKEEGVDDNCRSNLLTSLRMVKVDYCKNMERCSCPDVIESFNVKRCSSVTTISLLRGEQKLKSLHISNCNKILEQEWGGQKINNRSSMSLLEDVCIFGWSNLKSIIELNYFVHLITLKIEFCKSLESFPDNELPNLTSLKNLVITNCPSMDATFPRGLWPPKLRSLKIGRLKKPISEWGSQNFPTSLEELRLSSRKDEMMSSCSEFTHLLPSSLTSLHMGEFKKLESISMGLQHLTSLQHLGFICCPNMMDLPEMSLPSLLSLQIAHCSNLKERCSKGGVYWHLVSQIPRLQLDGGYFDF